MLCDTRSTVHKSFRGQRESKLYVTWQIVLFLVTTYCRLVGCDGLLVFVALSSLLPSPPYLSRESRLQDYCSIDGSRHSFRMLIYAYFLFYL